MSQFADMDASPDVGRLLRYLDDHDVYLSAIKAYVAAAAKRVIPGGRILDVGCGVGHDLVRMAEAGLTPVGVDSSAAALGRARETGQLLIRGDAERLPHRAVAAARRRPGRRSRRGRPGGASGRAGGGLRT